MAFLLLFSNDLVMMQHHHLPPQYPLVRFDLYQVYTTGKVIGVNDLSAVTFFKRCLMMKNFSIGSVTGVL